MITCETAEVDAQNAVSNLRLAVCLRPECRAEAELDTSECEKLRPELAGEDRVSIAHNRARETV